MYIKAFKIKRKILMVSIFAILTIFISGIVFAGGVDKECKDVPIIMYHHVLKDSGRQGKYVISPDEFEKDLLTLKEKGFTTVLIRDLIDYVDNKKELPQKPVVLTFDDGYESNHHYIIPVIEKYNEKIVISVVGEYSDVATETGDRNVNYSYLTWDEIKKLDNKGNVEIANHTYSFHNTGKRMGIGSIKGESEEEYKSLILPDLKKLNNKLKELTGREPLTFTYPFGKVSPLSHKLIKEAGFRASLSCEEGISSIEKNNPECLYLLKRYNRPSGISSKEFINKILKSTD